jgi:DNA replication protein DnaC
MLIQQTIQNLNDLHMKAMAEKLQELLGDPSTQNLGCFEQISLMVDSQLQERENNKLRRLLRQAKLKQEACIEDIDYRTPRGLDRQVISHLATCQYINSNLNVIITGPTGIGKTWLSCALGNAAVRKGKSVFSIRLARLFEDYEIARGDGSLRKLRTKLAKFDVLIIDDWALAPMNALVRHDLLELVDERSGKGSIIITSQLPVEKWHDYLGEPTVADAILDRLVQCAHRIELRGDSMRKADLSLSEKDDEKIQ